MSFQKIGKAVPNDPGDAGIGKPFPQDRQDGECLHDVTQGTGFDNADPLRFNLIQSC